MVASWNYFMVYTIILRFKNILRHLIIIFVMLNYFCCIKFYSSATIKVYNSKDYFHLEYESKCDITFTMEIHICNFLGVILRSRYLWTWYVTVVLENISEHNNDIWRIFYFSWIICLCFSLVCKFPMKRSIILFSK